MKFRGETHPFLMELGGLLFIGFARGTSKEFLAQFPPPQKKKRATSMALPCPSQVETRHHMDMRFEVSCSRIARLFHVA